MTTIIIIILLLTIAWLITGYKSFVYWWTKDHDYTTDDIPIAIVASFIGPIAYFMGMAIHGEFKIIEPKTIKPKKDQ